jgi:formylglycine-generating enzyme required for sulfatase activity
LTGKPYHLLSEAEWEYAARANKQTTYSWGDKIGQGNANCSGCGSQWDGRTAPVGSFAPNAFGLFDMHGNVWEWVEDCYHPNYLEAPTDGSAWTAGACSERVARSGGYDDTPDLLRSAFRFHNRTNFGNEYQGLRVARTLTP